MDKLPKVFPRSHHETAQEAYNLLKSVCPRLLKEPGKFPLVDFAEFQMPELLGYYLCVDKLPPYVEAETRVYSKELVLSEETYQALLEDDPRARFTIAHEVGHIVLHAEFLHKLNGNDSVRMVSLKRLKPFENPEVQANVFAAALLMPRKPFLSMLSELVRKKLPKEVIIDKLRKTFGVSKSAVETRLKNIRTF